MLTNGDQMVCLDNFPSGHIENLFPLIQRYPTTFKLIVSDIRNLEDCRKAVDGVEYTFHEVALGSVPPRIKNPIISNATNISGFLNMFVAVRDAGVKHFVYAVSSSIYGNSKTLPKVENVIGKSFSFYVITKYVNELYVNVFAHICGIETIGLQYFNVFGWR